MKIDIPENSPVIPSESRILGVPVFPATNDPRTFTFDNFSSDSCLTTTKFSTRVTFSELPQKFCQCPNILVADDDPFQNFFYEALFQKSISWKETIGTNENLKFEIFLNGEDLIKRFNKIKECGCGKNVLIISDYNMGPKNLNGVEVIKILRSNGFTGCAVLRTSEEEIHLNKQHPEFAEMIEKQQISSFLRKQNFKEAKEEIQKLIKKITGFEDE